MNNPPTTIAEAEAAVQKALSECNEAEEELRLAKQNLAAAKNDFQRLESGQWTPEQIAAIVREQVADMKDEGLL